MDESGCLLYAKINSHKAFYFHPMSSSIFLLALSLSALELAITHSPRLIQCVVRIICNCIIILLYVQPYYNHVHFL